MMICSSSLRFRGSGSLLFERGLGLLDEGFDGCGVLDGEVGEDFAVEGDAGGFETLHKSGVAQAEGACGGVDALDPEVAEAALLGLAVACGVGFGLADGVLGITEVGTAESAEPFGFGQHALAALPAGGGIGGSWHVSLSMIRLLFG